MCGQGICIAKVSSYGFFLAAVLRYRNNNYCQQLNENPSSEIFNEMTFANQNIELAILSMAISVLLKVLFGVITLTMFTSVYIKIKIIHEQRSFNEWTHKFKRIVFGTFFLVITLNLLFGITI